MSLSWLFLGGVVSTRPRLRFTNRGQCAVNSVRWSRIFQRTATYLLTGCLTPGGKCKRSLYGAELTLAAVRGSEYQSLVQLYRALGGGWQQ